MLESIGRCDAGICRPNRRAKGDLELEMIEFRSSGSRINLMGDIELEHQKDV
jgi:hypothetical protein